MERNSHLNKNNKTKIKTKYTKSHNGIIEVLILSKADLLSAELVD